MLQPHSRRVFLKGGVSVLTVGLAMPSVFTRSVFSSEQASAGAQPGSGAGTLVVVQMAGGNDGINTIIPYKDPAYRTARGTLAIPDDQIIPLNDSFGMHPAMAALKPLWDARKLAVVNNVGYARPTLSHFEAMDVWYNADPERKQNGSGWLSRFVETVVDGQSPRYPGLSVGRALPPALCCTRTPPTILNNLNNYRLLADPRFTDGSSQRERSLLSLYDSYQAPAPYAAVMDATADYAVQSVATLQRIAQEYQPAATYPAGPLAAGLKLLAETIAGDVGLRVGYVSIGGFDTHANQAAPHQRLLQTLSEALAAFQQDLAGHGKDQNVVVMTWSEFGRRVQSNANGGTDHGTAAPLFVLGARVRGGFYGDAPDLKSLDRGNLKYSTDFRSVYATMIEQVLGADPASALGARYPSLPLLA